MKSNVIQFPARNSPPILPQRDDSAGLDINEYITAGQDGYRAIFARETIKGVCEKGDLTFVKNGVITHVLRKVA